MEQPMMNLTPAIAMISLGAMAALAAVTNHGPATSDPSDCAAGARRLHRLELVFGMSRPRGPEISDGEWQSFLDAEVTPRFPQGFTVLSGAGQWSGKEGLAKEVSRLLIVWHEGAEKRNAQIEDIRLAYKLFFDQESVLRIDSHACVSF